MTNEQKDLLSTAMMLLEIAFEEEVAEIASPDDFTAAAHSFIQVAIHGGEHHSDAEEIAAKYWAAVAIADAQDRAGTAGRAAD